MDTDALSAMLKRQRAELFALQLLIDGFLLALPPASRAIVQRQFEQQAERWLVGALHHAEHDETVHAMQAAVDRLKTRIDAVKQL